MISVESYYEKIKNYSRKELLDEKSKLEQFIKKYNDNFLSEKNISLKTAPEVVVMFYKEYLKRYRKALIYATSYDIEQKIKEKKLKNKESQKVLVLRKKFRGKSLKVA